jgi:hypothetical protein
MSGGSKITMISLKYNHEDIPIMFFGVFIVMLGLYAYTLAPTILWGDPAKLINLVNYGQPKYLDGGAHGLHTRLGIIFAEILPNSWPLAYKINLMSAFFSSLALSITYVIIYYLVRSPISALGATACIGLSHMYWLVATITESYSLLSFTFALNLGSFILWYERQNNWLLLVLLGTIVLGFLNHYLTLLFIPAYAFFVVYLSNNRPRILLIYLFLSLVCLVLVSTDEGNRVVQALLHTTYIGLTRFSNYSKLLREFLLFPIYLLYQYPLATIFGLIGIYHALKSRRKKIAFLFIVLIVMDVIFASFYGEARQLYQLIPTFIIFGYFIAVGFLSVTIKMTLKKSIILISTVILFQPMVYFVVTRSASHIFMINLVSNSTFKYRDPNIYYLWPSKRGNYETYDFAKKALGAMESGGIILADFNISEPLKYIQDVDGFRKDIRIECTNSFSYQREEDIWRNVRNYIDEKLAKGEKVYIAAYECFNFFTIEKKTIPFRARLDNTYKIVEIENIFRIVKKLNGKNKNENYNKD